MSRLAWGVAFLGLGLAAAETRLIAQEAPAEAPAAAGGGTATASPPAAANPPAVVNPPTGERPEGRGPGGPGGGPGGFPGFGGPGGGRGGFGGGGFGGFGGNRGGGVLGEAMRSEVQAELKLTEEQIAKAREISEAQRGQFDPTIFQRMQAATTDEERQKLVAEMQANAEKLRKEAEEQFQAVVSPEQFARLKQLSLQRQGPSALTDEAVAADLKLAPEQVETLKKLIDESRQASMARGFRVSREERDQMRADLEAKLVAVLTDDQKKGWTEKLGAPAPAAPERDDRGPRGFGGPPGGGLVPAPAGTAPGLPPVVASGTSAGGSPAPVVTPPPGVAPMAEAPPAAVVVNGEKKLTFNFRFAPWELVLKWFAEQAELTIDLTATPPGTFNYYDNGQYSITEALDILNGYLIQKGYILVRRDKFLVSLNIDNGIPPNLVPQVSLEELDKRGKNELLSVVLPLEGTDADTAAADIKELVGPQGKVVPLKKTNRLFITDIGSNLRKIYALLSASGSVAAGTKTFRSFELKHISALEADRLLRDLFGLPQRTAGGTVVTTPAVPMFQPNQGGRDGRWWENRGDRDRGNDGQPQPQPGQPGMPIPNSGQNQMQIAIDSRTGSLLVTAKAEEMALVEQAIKSIDVEGAKGGGNGQPQLEVFPLQTADTRAVVEMLNTLIPGMRITEDSKARRVSVYAGPTELAQVREIVKQLDGSAGDNASVIPLRRLDPVAAAQSLKSLFGGNRSDGPSIEADAQGRRILVRGSSDQVAQVRTILSQMGEDGTSSGGGTGGGLRTISLGGRDAQQVLSLLQELWPKDEGNPIRVVVPSAISPTMDGARRRGDTGGIGPIQRIVTPEPIVAPKESVEDTSGEDGSLDEAFEAASEAAEPGNIADELRALFGEGPAEPDSKTRPTGKEPAADESKGAPGKAVVDPELEDAKAAVGAAKSGEGAPIVVSPNGGSLIITSDDEAALDRVEKVIATLLQAAPARTKWTVFYLRTADATETATILGNLFPQGSVLKADSGSGMFSGLGSSLSTLGSSVGEMTGLNSLSKSSEALRIVAEPRSNALFVTGPADTVAQIEATLKILDANELPESYRERVPRSIVVEYADVLKVAEVVKEVYKEQLEANPLAALAGGGNRGGGINPLAMMMGGMAGGANQKAPKVQMTLAVDERANTLIVSSSESLFKQVESMVKTIDLAAKEAKATVRVVPLTNTNGAVISQALGALVPKVKVVSTSGISSSGSTGGSRPSSSSGSGPTITPPSGDSGGDPIRAMFEQRIRERMMEGGGGGFRGGFPGGGFPGGEGGFRGFGRGGSDNGERRRRE